MDHGSVCEVVRSLFLPKRDAEEKLGLVEVRGGCPLRDAVHRRLGKQLADGAEIATGKRHIRRHTTVQRT